MIVTRFAPSPNGPLHLGHAFSAIVAHDLAKERDGRFLLRVEDIDGARSRPELADAFRADLAWLGLEWEEVPAQSTRLAAYAEAAQNLWTRIRTAYGAAQGGEWTWYAQGAARPPQALASLWKCPYHNGRAMLELDQRLKNIKTTGGQA